MSERRTDPAARTLLEEAESIEASRVHESGWWAWERSESGWVFAIGATGDLSPGWRYFGGSEPPEDGPPGRDWRILTAGTGVALGPDRPSPGGPTCPATPGARSA